MVLAALFTALIILAADARMQNSVEVNNEDNPLNLPKNPLVIQMSKEDHSYENRSPRIEYRGYYKFCVGRVVGSPVGDNVWNPINQTAYQNYYFRYVKVDMTECKFNIYSKFPKIQELFYDSDRTYYPYFDNNGYNVSLPFKQATFSSFYFLIYNPQRTPEYKFKVRWTAYIDLGEYPDPSVPIDEHYEPDAFDPASYIWKFDD